MDRADEFGLSTGRAEFVGWWAHAKYVEQTPADRKMKCSLWKGPGKALLMLGNANSGIDGKTKITVKPDTLGIAGHLTATDWWTREAIPMDGNSLTIDVAWNLFCPAQRAQRWRRRN